MQTLLAFKDATFDTMIGMMSKVQAAQEKLSTEKEQLHAKLRASENSVSLSYLTLPVGSLIVISGIA